MKTATEGASQGPATNLDGRPAALLVDGVTAGYHDTTILRDVSIKVAAGSVVALIGPNGAGKTTLLRAISGLIPLRAGRVHLGGVDISDEAPHRRVQKGLCHVPEGRGIYRNLSVRENLLMQSVRGRETESIDRAVGTFPVLGQRLGQAAGTMSGGEQQMLAMSAAFAQDPQIVVVDEPSLGLAPIIVDQLFESLRSLAERGSALLIIDQFVSRVLKLADAAYVLRRGEIVFDGSADQLLAGNLFDRYIGDA